MSVSRLLPPDIIRQVAGANPIEEVIGADLTLRKAGAVLLALCPFHREKTPSLTVTPARQRFKCFGCGAAGDVFSYVMTRENVSFPESALILAQRAGIPVETVATSTNKRPSCTSRPKLVVKRPEQRPFHLPADRHRGAKGELRAVSEQRGLSMEGLSLADERGLLRFGSLYDHRSWIVTDAESVNAQARRMDGGLWQHIGGKKAYTLPGARAAWPIGTREAEAFPCVVLVEGGPDLLAAHHFIVAEEREADTAAVAMLGAANDVPENALLLLANKRVRLFPHLDAAGRDAALRWSSQLERVGCEVDAFSFDDLRRADGAAVGDLNDLAVVDADDFEAERPDLERILPE